MATIARTATSLSALAVALAVASPAFAQEAPAQSHEDVIVVAQQAQKQVVSDGNVGVLGAQDALSTPFNISTYTSQLILDQQAETIGEVMENDPAVRTTYGSGNQSELFVIRGFALFGDDVSIDGLYGVTPRQIVSPELFDNVQVLNGASAFLFGAAPGGSGIGGGINLTPKRAHRTLFRATANFSQDSIFGGTFDAGTRFGADQAFGIRVNGVYRKGETAIDHDQREVRAASVDFDFRKGPGRFFLDFGYEDQRANWSRPEVRLATGVAVPAVPDGNYNYGQPWTYTKLRDLYVIARVELDITKGVMVYAAAGARDAAESGDYSTVTVNNLGPINAALTQGTVVGGGTASRLFVPREDNNESGQIGIRAKFKTGGISHQINAGGSVNYTDNRNSFTSGGFDASLRTGCGIAAATTTSFCTNLYNAPQVPKPANVTLPSSGGNLTDLPHVATTEFRSLFVSDTIGFLDDRVLVTGGVRRQWMVIDAWNRGTLQRTTRYNEARTTPVIGVVVKPTDHFSLYANRIEGLAQGPTAPITTTVNPGQVFAPFQSVQYEAGGKLQIHGLTATVAVYQTKQPNSYTAITPIAGNANATTFFVDGEQRNRGIELSFNGEPSRFIRLIGGATFSEAKVTSGLLNPPAPQVSVVGKTAVGVPDFQANLGAEVVLPFLPKMTVTGRVVITGKQWVDAANTQRLPGWTRFDLGARYVFVAAEHPITLRVSAENIDNRRYWYSAFGGYLVQGSPRTVKASVTFEY
ncbi:MAG: TonB-dependent siderophore receptor [Pseudomonadota bacterium]